MGGTTHQEPQVTLDAGGYDKTLDRQVTQCLSLTEKPLSPVQVEIVKLRCGVYSSGHPLSLGVIGSVLDGFGFRSLSRQRVHVLYRGALDAMGIKSEKCLAGRFDVMRVTSLYDMREGPSVNSLGRLRSYFFQKKIPAIPIQYAEALRAAGVEIPDHRKKLADAYDEEASCRALFEDFGIRRFGDRYKVCTQCPPDEALRPMGDFYRAKNGLWMSACKKCDSARCVEKARRKKQLAV